MGRSEFEMPVGDFLRLGVTAIGCVGAGVFMLIKAHFETEVTPLESLQQVNGIVQVETEYYRSRRSSKPYPVFTINRQRFTYPYWFPQARELAESVNSGETITVWTDAFKNAWVYQIERDGQQIVSYAKVHDGIIAHRAWYPVVGFGMIIFGFVVAGRLAILSQPYWMPEPTPQDKVVKVKKKKKRVKTRLKELDE
ncbi:MAG TPA: hypothetical protein VGM98_09155 [Schlesneria sp.]|jgi:hypothetical protein